MAGMDDFSAPRLETVTIYTHEFHLPLPRMNPRKNLRSLVLLVMMAGVLLAAMPARAINLAENAVQGQWPSIVGLVRSSLDNAHGFYCAGSLIAPRWVVTAAHCVSGVNAAYLEVVSGLYALSQTAGTQRIAVQQIIVHPDYNKPVLNADIALLRLASVSSSPVLPVMGASTHLDAMYATMLGWGYQSLSGSNPDLLQQAQVPIVSQARCADAYAGIQTIYNSMVCAGDGLGGPSLCTQDSGGPLLIELQGQTVLAGVASFNRGCGSVGYYSGFSRVSSRLNFLQQYVPGLQVVRTEPVYTPAAVLLLLLGP